MPRYIDAEQMEKHIMESKVFNQYFKELVQSLIWGENTVDVVPVVRCGECKNFSPRNLVNFCSRTGRTCENNDYCSYGEKREDG